MGNDTGTLDTAALKKALIIRVCAVYAIIGVAFFLPAGTFRYWQAWTYLAALAVPMVIFGVYMFKHDPKFLERRIRTDEKRKEQRLIVRFGIVPFLISFLVPGFDIRFHWSDVPVVVSLTGLALVLAAYLMTLYVFIINSFASRVVEVEKGQKVISTGPYALVRHPMYLCNIVFYIATAPALGSYWAIVPAVTIIPVLVFRIVDEEKELLQNLEGYAEYMKKVKYRLLPGVW